MVMVSCGGSSDGQFVNVVVVVVVVSCGSGQWLYVVCGVGSQW